MLGKYSKNHCSYALHGRVTPLAHMHCYYTGSFGCPKFWGQGLLRVTSGQKPKIFQKCLFQDVNIAEQHDLDICIGDT